jgi:hypothetical protein
MFTNIERTVLPAIPFIPRPVKGKFLWVCGHDLVSLIWKVSLFADTIRKSNDRRSDGLFWF